MCVIQRRIQTIDMKNIFIMVTLSVWVCISLTPISILTARGYKTLSVEDRQQSMIHILEKEIRRLKQEVETHQWDQFLLLYYREMLQHQHGR